MNKKILFCIFLFLSFLCVNAQMSYYYKGDKIPLSVDKNFVHIITDEVFVKSSSSSRLFQELNVERVDSRPVQGLLKLKLNSVSDMSGYSLIVKSLKQNEQIKYVLPFFERKDADPIGTSDVFYIQLKSVDDIALLEKISKQLNVQIVKQIPYMPLWYILSIKNSAFSNSIEATNYFYETRLFEEIDPAFMFDFKPNCTNDPMFSQLWGLRKTTSSSDVGINICDAWNITRGAGINVAVIDQGIDPNHNDLKGNFHNLSFDAASGTPSSVYNSSQNHGTHVAGTIAAIRNNGLQVVGVAPESKIMRVSHHMTPAYSVDFSAELASGISWAYQNGADVINNSWGDQGGLFYSDLYSAALEFSIVSALSFGRNNKGCVVIFSAGNWSVIDYPAYFHNEILVVGSVQNNGIRAYDSGMGFQLDVVAPGVNILSTINNNGTGFNSGTSMAAPHASGVAALILSLNPNLTGRQVRDIIESTTQKVGGYTYSTVPGRNNGFYDSSLQMGYGLIDAYAALKSLCVSNYSNKTVTTNTTILCCGNTLSVENVTVSNNAKLTIISEGAEITFRNFDVQSGSSYEIIR